MTPFSSGNDFAGINQFIGAELHLGFAIKAGPPAHLGFAVMEGQQLRPIVGGLASSCPVV